MVMYHTEKNAIAFGLMTTTGNKSIRMVKNLEVYSDCHEAMNFTTLL